MHHLCWMLAVSGSSWELPCDALAPLVDTRWIPGVLNPIFALTINNDGLMNF